MRIGVLVLAALLGQAPGEAPHAQAPPKEREVAPDPNIYCQVCITVGEGTDKAKTRCYRIKCDDAPGPMTWGGNPRALCPNGLPAKRGRCGTQIE
jgi:hypothetical protein